VLIVPGENSDENEVLDHRRICTSLKLDRGRDDSLIAKIWLD
jgi:hypothetical protein